MKPKYLVAISDTHGNNEMLARVAASLRHLLERYQKPLEDCAILYLGDALPVEKIPEEDVEKHYREFAKALAAAELPVIGTGGNYDIEDAVRAVFKEKGWTFLHGETAEWNGLKFAGYGGSRIPGAGKAAEELGLPEEKFVHFDDEDLVGKLADKEIDVFIHHTMPYRFMDKIGYAQVMTPEGPGIMPIHIGGAGINKVLAETTPVLSICGHIHQSTGSHAEDRTLMIKCKGFSSDNDFPVYYVEIAYDQDGKPFVKSNVDIGFAAPEARALMQPLVTCREEYECNSKEMVHHYRVFKQEIKGSPVIIRAIKTEEGFKPISQKPALAGSDDISWAFAADDEEKPGRAGIILL